MTRDWGNLELDTKLSVAAMTEIGEVDLGVPDKLHEAGVLVKDQTFWHSNLARKAHQSFHHSLTVLGLDHLQVDQLANGTNKCHNVTLGTDNSLVPGLPLMSWNKCLIWTINICVTVMKNWNK